MKNTLKFALVLLMGTAIATGCKKDKDDPAAPAPPVNENEVITDLYLHFTGAGSTPYTWHASTTNGLGVGTGLEIHADTLPANGLLQATMLLLNRSVTPVDTISHEVFEEGTLHQFFFLPNGVNATFTYADQDANGHPIGLQSEWHLGAASTGTIKVVLRHEPDKSAAGVNSGDITNAGGSTDLEVEFPAVIH